MGVLRLYQEEGFEVPAGAGTTVFTSHPFGGLRTGLTFPRQGGRDFFGGSLAVWLFYFDYALYDDGDVAGEGGHAGGGTGMAAGVAV